MMTLLRVSMQGAIPFLGTLFLVGHGLFGADWSRFHGPNGSGYTAEAGTLPAKFSATENLQWKVSLPGPGSSSPIVVGDKLFVTCWSGYGTGEGEVGEQKNLRRHLICIDRQSGKTIWSKEVEPVLPEDEYEGMFAQHGYASHTPVSDGERVYVYFGKTGALAFDMAGNQLWKTKIGTESDPRGWGSASSPILYKDLVIVTASAESEAMVALNKNTGEEVWRKEAGGFNGTWGTPVLVPIDDTRTDLVLGVPNEFWAFDPETGKMRWFCETMESNSYCSSVLTDGGVVYGIEGQGGGSVAVKAGGMGDVTKSHTVWTGRDRNRIGTPVLYEGKLYFFSSGVANCIDAASGQEIYRSRLATGTPSTPTEGTNAAPPADNRGPEAGGDSERREGRGEGRGRGRGGMGGQNYSSPVAGDGKLFYVTRNGEIHVVKLGAEFEQLAVNRLTDETEDFSATPAIGNGQLFVRSNKHLYCISLTPGQ